MTKSVLIRENTSHRKPVFLHIWRGEDFLSGHLLAQS